MLLNFLQNYLLFIVCSPGCKKFICIIPETDDFRKQWSLKNFDEIIKYLRKKYSSYQIILTGANEEKLNWLNERNPETIKLVKPNLLMLYSILKKSDLVLSLDVGPMHLAWAGNAKLIVLMKKRSINSFNNIKPLSKNSYVLKEKEGILPVDEVKKEIEKVLKIKLKN